MDITNASISIRNQAVTIRCKDVENDFQIRLRIDLEKHSIKSTSGTIGSENQMVFTAAGLSPNGMYDFAKYVSQCVSEDLMDLFLAVADACPGKTQEEFVPKVKCSICNRWTRIDKTERKPVGDGRSVYECVNVDKCTEAEDN